MEQHKQQAAAGRRIHLVPSTHWDREWYLPFRRFQVRLVRLLDKVQILLERGEFPCFLMDGQWIVLEDYLEIRPEREEALRTLIRERRLVFGPWYVVPDTLTVSGESLVRNLRIGQQMARRYGGGLHTGYSPDSFGLAAQLPQLYREMGLQAALFTRGRRPGQGSMEMRWMAPDGSVLPALFGEYSRGLTLTAPTVWRNIDRLETAPEEAEREARRLLEDDDRRTRLHSRLWIVGVDHLEPREHLGCTAAYLDAAIPDVSFELSDLDSFFRCFNEELEHMDAPLVSGEQRGPYEEHFLLGNTLSARMDLKMKNRRAEDLLAYVAVPLQALAGTPLSFWETDTRAIGEFAWRLLVQNHAHDTICCCSDDATLRDMEHRLDNCLQLAREMEKEELRRLGARARPGASAGAVLVYNPLPFARSRRVRARVAVPCALRGRRLVDAAGRAAPNARVRAVFRKRIDIETLKTNEFDELLADTTRYPLGGEEDTDLYTGLEVAFDALDIPACGYRCYYFDCGEPETPKAAAPVPESLENAFVRVTVHEDGTLDILDKTTGRRVERTHYFEVQGDEGDTYTFSPAGERAETRGRPARIVWREDGAVIGQSLTWGDGRVDLHTLVELDPFSPAVRLTVTVQNTARDIRLRAVLEYPDTVGTAYGNTAFDLTPRPVFTAAERTDKSIQTMPMRDVLLLPFEGGPEAVFSRSVQEYEAVSDGGTRVALTLLRAVGRVYATRTLTKDETACGEGVRWWTEDAQMQGEYRLCYGLCRYRPGVSKTTVMNDALDFSLPLSVSGALAEGTDGTEAERCRVENAVLSAVERDDGGALLVRVYNPDDVPQAARVTVRQPIAAAAFCDLRGDVLEEVSVRDGHTVEWELAPHRIRTLRLAASDMV